MSDYSMCIQKIAEELCPVIPQRSMEVPHLLRWDGGGPEDCLTDEERHNCLQLVEGVVRCLTRPTGEMVEAIRGAAGDAGMAGYMAGLGAALRLTQMDLDRLLEALA